MILKKEPMIINTHQIQQVIVIVGYQIKKKKMNMYAVILIIANYLTIKDVNYWININLKISKNIGKYKN